MAAYTTPIHEQYPQMPSNVTFDGNNMDQDSVFWSDFLVGTENVIFTYDVEANETTATAHRDDGQYVVPFSCTWKGVFSQADPLNLTLSVSLSLL